MNLRAFSFLSLLTIPALAQPTAPSVRILLPERTRLLQGQLVDLVLEVRNGMSMTYGTDSIVPDSANTGTAWATGNKSFLNAVNVFADVND